MAIALVCGSVVIGASFWWEEKQKRRRENQMKEREMKALEWKCRVLKRRYKVAQDIWTVVISTMLETD